MKKVTKKRPPGKSSIDGNANGGNRRSDPNLRPTKYTDALAESVLSQMRDGKSSYQIMRDDPKAPHRQTIYAWANGMDGAPDDFRYQYAQAGAMRADHYVERMLAIAESMDEDKRRQAERAYREALENGASTFQINTLVHDAERRSVEAARLQVDVLKFTSSRLHPNRWGNALAITGGGEDTPPVRVDLKNMSTEDLEILAAMEKRLSSDKD